jgi:hypothetical protein
MAKRFCLAADHYWSGGDRGFTPLLGSVLWWILPQDIKDLITGIINLGMMMLIMFILMQVMKPLTASQKPRTVEQAKEIEEART